jgi:tagatose-1,6-bisphosphate aldolase non-catalytic subunit AgaZ/GatZ
MSNITSNMFSFIFSDRITYNLWEKTKVKTLSADYTKNLNSRTVIKTIIDGGHLGKIIDQK